MKTQQLAQKLRDVRNVLPDEHYKPLTEIAEALDAYCDPVQHLLLTAAEAMDALAPYFPWSQRRLRIDSDPEDGTQTLVIEVVTKQSVERASDMLRLFDEEWLFKRKHEGLCVILQWEEEGRA